MNYPKSIDLKIQKLSNILIKYADSKGYEFTFSEQEIYNLETFSDFGGLSLFLLESKDLYEKIYNNLYTVEELMLTIGNRTKKLSIEDSIKEQEFLESRVKDVKFPISFYEKEENTYFGFIPLISENEKIDFFNLSHITIKILDDYVKFCNDKNLTKNNKIPLDPLIEKLNNKILSQKIIIIPITEEIKKKLELSELKNK